MLTRDNRRLFSTGLVLVLAGLSWTGVPMAYAQTVPDLTAPAPSSTATATAAASPVIALPSAPATPLPTSSVPVARPSATVPAPGTVVPAVPQTATLPAATSSQVTELKTGQAPAMPPALTPEPGTLSAPPGPADIGKAVNQQLVKNAATAANLPAIGGPNSASIPAGPNPSIGGAPGPATGVANEPVRPGPGMAGPAGPDTYYDSLGPTPSGPMAAGVGPRKVNPAQEPGQKFIVVETDAGPGSREAKLTAADRALKLGHYDAAADMYDALYERDPHDPRVLMGRAVAYQNSGRPEAAAKMYDALLDRDPRNLDAQVNMLGMMSHQYPEVALRRLLDLHEKYPADATLEAQIGVTEGQQGQYDDALRYLQMASAEEPHNAQHQLNLAIIADKAGKKADAMNYYQESLETDAVYGGSRSIPRDQVYDRLAQLRQQP